MIIHRQLGRGALALAALCALWLCLPEPSTGQRMRPVTTTVTRSAEARTLTGVGVDDPATRTAREGGSAGGAAAGQGAERELAPEETAQDALRPRLADLPRVVLEERVPRAWIVNDADRFLLTPARRRRRLPRRCRTRGGYREFCQGPRVVASPSPEAAAVATRLGLGQSFTARILISEPPLPEWIAAVEHEDPEGALTFPVPGGHLGRGYGYVRRGSLRRHKHKGVDIGAPEGSTIVAARGGLVAYSDNGLTGYGNVVILLHREGYTTLYAHCRATLVAAGEWVERGQPIAEVGETGFAYAPHLHFEWRQRGWVRDPARHLRADRSREQTR